MFVPPPRPDNTSFSANVLCPTLAAGINGKEFESSLFNSSLIEDVIAALAVTAVADVLFILLVAGVLLVTGAATVLSTKE